MTAALVAGDVEVGDAVVKLAFAAPSRRLTAPLVERYVALIAGLPAPDHVRAITFAAAVVELGVRALELYIGALVRAQPGEEAVAGALRAMLAWRDTMRPMLAMQALTALEMVGSPAIGMAFTLVMHSAVGSRPEDVEQPRARLPWCETPGDARNLQLAAVNIYVPALSRLGRWEEAARICELALASHFSIGHAAWTVCRRITSHPSPTPALLDSLLAILRQLLSKPSPNTQRGTLSSALALLLAAGRSLDAASLLYTCLRAPGGGRDVLCVRRHVSQVCTALLRSRSTRPEAAALLEALAQSDATAPYESPPQRLADEQIFNTFVADAMREGDAPAVRSLLQRMRQLGIKPNEMTLTAVSSAKPAEAAAAAAARSAAKPEAAAAATAHAGDAATTASRADTAAAAPAAATRSTLAGLNRELDALVLFGRARMRPGAASSMAPLSRQIECTPYNKLIHGFFREHAPARALDVLARMLEMGITPGDDTLRILLFGVALSGLPTGDAAWRSLPASWGGCLDASQQKYSPVWNGVDLLLDDCHRAQAHGDTYAPAHLKTEVGRVLVAHLAIFQPWTSHADLRMQRTSSELDGAPLAAGASPTEITRAAALRAARMTDTVAPALAKARASDDLLQHIPELLQRLLAAGVAPDSIARAGEVALSMIKHARIPHERTMTLFLTLYNSGVWTSSLTSLWHASQSLHCEVFDVRSVQHTTVSLFVATVLSGLAREAGSEACDYVFLTGSNKQLKYAVKMMLFCSQPSLVAHVTPVSCILQRSQIIAWREEKRGQ